jgi:hypothetical protein
MNENPPLAPVDQLNALITDYSLARDDERQHTLAIGALYTILVAVVLAEASQFAQACGPSSAADCTQIPGLVYAIAPMPVFAVLALTVLIGTEATMRYAYMVALERRIEELAVGLTLDDLDRPAFSLQRARRPLVVFATASLRRHPFPYLFFFMLAPLAVIAAALTVYCLAQVEPLAILVSAGVFYGVAALLILYCAGLGWVARLWREKWPEKEATMLNQASSSR